MAVKSQATVVLFYVITNGVRQEVYDIEIKEYSNYHKRPAYVKALHAYVLLCFGYLNDPQKSWHFSVCILEDNLKQNAKLVQNTKDIEKLSHFKKS